MSISDPTALVSRTRECAMAYVLSAFLQTLVQPPEKPRLPQGGDRVLIRPNEGEISIQIRGDNDAGGAEVVARINGVEQPSPSRWLTLGIGAREQLSPDGLMMLISACTGLAYRVHTPMTGGMICYELVTAPPDTTP